MAKTRATTRATTKATTKAATKRACQVAAAVVDLEGAVIAIVQCLDRASDVTALLQALPHASLGTPLTALLALLNEPGPLAHTWPELLLDDVNFQHPAFVALILQAMPVLLSVRAAHRHLFGCLLQPDDSTIDAPDGFLNFVAQYPRTMMHVHAAWRDAMDCTVFCNALRRCTRLTTVHVVADAQAAAVLAAITTPAHRVTRLYITEMPGGIMDAIDWASLLRPWLASGHARHVTFSNVPITDVQSLAEALLRSSSLHSLGVHNNDKLLRSLLSQDMSLRQLNQVSVTTQVAALLPRLLGRLSLSTLTSLSLECDMDHSETLALLPSMPSLRHLALTGGHLGELDCILAWPHLKRLTCSRVHLTPRTLDAILWYLGRVDGLEHLLLDVADLDEMYFVYVAQRLGHLMERAAPLCWHWRCANDATVSSPLMLDVGEHSLSIDGIRMVLEALAICKFVCIKMVPIDGTELAPFHDEIQAFAAAHCMICDLTYPPFMLCSPTDVVYEQR
ncbi:hypothetical protein SPRG_09730 [Saprolegnia parasitica CBS 223.65]|uniref:Uncharacterized protein n=1 Tax=Saprolegnia parasitica (strain CBS 223.65) TaxID=695850 RepID=A0A067C758_SAPPC|nr:hypothetical protein SPRG_09730 [Saprolegnia parasitica CBS 223.65]KDO25000.1 hypothetical protein SPRG_09730 [Saprolegnia parasitica CBS 223.65]|eukprot:XP_012204269.1 hypothetical protein SPRG_09730 [Saprolegnia parasitica CBS 223.65]